MIRFLSTLMIFLKTEKVEQEEEQIRLSIRNLPDTTRQKIFGELKHKLKDPDTYAALNYGLIAGLHHLYLGKFLRAFLELLIFIFGIFLLINDFMLGFIFVSSMILLELFELFRSQITVKHHNNIIMKRIIKRYAPSVFIK